MTQKINLVTLIAVLALSGCGANPTETTTTNHSTTAAEKQAAAPTASPSADVVEMDNYKFKLSPDIQKNGEAHLDFYVHDEKDAHVPGVTGTFHIIMPDGTKETLAIEEEKPHDHYHGMLMLKQYGEYKVAAQAQIDGKKYNPRFAFERKAQ